MNRVTAVKVSIRKCILALALKFRRWTFGKLIDYRHNMQSSIKGSYYVRLRIHFNLPLVGEDEEKDRRLHEAVEKFFDGGHEIREGFRKNSGDKFFQWLLEDSQASKDLDSYYLLSHWFSIEEQEKSEISRQYRLYFNRELISLDLRSVRKLRDAYQKRHRREVKEFRESKAQLVSIELKDATLLLSWLPIFLILGGYAYTNIVFGRFGIVPSQFFSVSDYFSASLEQVHHVFIGAVSFLGGLVHSHWKAGTLTLHESLQRVRSSRTHERIVAVVSCLFFVGHFYVAPLPPMLATLAAIGIFQHPIFYYAEKYYKKGLPIGLALLFTFAFFASIGFGAQERIREIENSHHADSFQITAGNMRFSEKNSSFIGANSRYIFLKTAQERVEIIRVDQVDRILFERSAK